MITNGTPAGLDGLEIAETAVSPGRTITEADVVSFAALTGDWHPQHSDATWAAESRFGRRVAHGMLLLSYAVGLVPLDPSRVVALRGISDVVFKRPVHIGDTIRVTSRIDDVKPLDEETALVRVSWRIVNQSGEGVARAKLAIVWRRGAAAADRPSNEPELDEVFP
jgi:3-hydroxybutyryl-CoA dehydratase